ncbi:MAG: DUF2127 domain-containing protein [Acidobacteriota bacterium]|nr:DUF2127 domain-containing protein [Acidobacteriota bacterium]
MPSKRSGARRDAWIFLIGLFKLFKGLSLLILGIGLLRLLHRDVASVAQHWVEVLRVDPDNRFVHRALARIFRVTPKQLKELSVGTFIYAGIFLTEAMGLLARKRWAEYMTLVSTSLFIPLEIYEIFHRFTWLKVGVTAVNLLIVWYLAARLKPRTGVFRNSGAYLFVAALLCAPALLSGARSPVFRNDPVPADLLEKIRKTTWHPGCPVGPEDLRQLTLSFHDFENHTRLGTLVVNRELANEVVRHFEALYRHGFRIERMTPIEDYGGDDEASMAANNTSGFNCRDATGKPGVFSNHSWGRAIDINPLTNPYVKGDKVLPPQGRRYLDRTKDVPGSILKDGFAVREFEKAGWTWGGQWPDRQDYQHFEKPARHK